MNLLIFPWSITVVFISILFLLIIREVGIALHAPSSHPERKMALFNSFILLLFFIASLYGVRILMLHDAQFATLFLRYPNSRYAPEREFFSKTGDWVYTTKDDIDTVVNFYHRESKNKGFQTTLDNTSGNPRFLLAKEGNNIFLTIVKEKNSTILYFSQKGEITSSPVASQ